MRRIGVAGAKGRLSPVPDPGVVAAGPDQPHLKKMETDLSWSENDVPFFLFTVETAKNPPIRPTRIALYRRCGVYAFTKLS
jgi:hypothetical protein